MKFHSFKHIFNPGNLFHTHKTTGRSDGVLIFLIFLLSLIGILFVYDSSVVIAMRDFSDRFYFAKEQMKWLGLGIFVFSVFSIIPYKYWYRAAVPILMVTIGLLIIVFIPGISVKALGARRWINLGFTVLQPAEFAKLALIIYLSAWFSSKERKRLASFLMLMGIVVGLILLEPDLGTASIILVIAMCLYFFSGAPIMHFVFLVPLMIIGVLILALISPYRFARLTSFMNPEKDPLGSSYQIRQATLALGSGGLLGVGIGKSRQKYEYLPEANTDSIFAIIGEETGLIGATAISLLYMFIVYRGYKIALKASDGFGRLLALGISSWIGLQSLINIAAISALIPLTGVPLPLISYGGSNLVVMLAGLGILVRVSKQ
jgi:cell division protein FtsW